MAVKKPRITFPVGGGTDIDFGENLKRDDVFDDVGDFITSIGGTGKLQRNHNFNSEILVAQFQFETLTIVNEVKTFVTTHGFLGKVFEWVPDRIAAPGTKFNVQLMDKEFKPIRMFGGVDLYEFSLTLRKEIT